MKYSTPELVVLGTAQQLVLGGDPGMYENLISETSKQLCETCIGLDD
jgi:hypothetical protein